MPRLALLETAVAVLGVLLFVGVFRYYKGLSYLLEAMQWVPATLLLVGGGPLEDELRAQADGLGLAERVRFVGRVSDKDLPAYYHAADLFVLPSCERSEAYGLAQLRFHDLFARGSLSVPGVYPTYVAD